MSTHPDNRRRARTTRQSRRVVAIVAPTTEAAVFWTEAGGAVDDDASRARAPPRAPADSKPPNHQPGFDSCDGGFGHACAVSWENARPAGEV